MEEYKVFAEKMKDIIKVGAVDCKKDEELCEEFNLQPPTIMVYGALEKD